jgi:hypothetical protein
MLNIDERLLTEADDSETFLLLHIGKHMNASNFAFPSNAELCRATKWNIKKLQRVKTSLIEKKMISAARRLQEKKGQTSNGYTILTDRLGVHINLKGRGVQQTIPIPPLGTGGVPPGGVGALPPGGVPNEVLVNEVLEEKERADFLQNPLGFMFKKLLEMQEENKALAAKSKKHEQDQAAARRRANNPDLGDHFSRFDHPAAMPQLWDRWCQHKADYGHKYKSADSVVTGLKKLHRLSGGKYAVALEIIENSIGNGWQGLFEVKKSQPAISTPTPERGSIPKHVKVYG